MSGGRTRNTTYRKSIGRPELRKKLKNIEWGSEYASTKLLSDELRMPHDILRRYSNIYELYDDILA